VSNTKAFKYHCIDTLRFMLPSLDQYLRFTQRAHPRRPDGYLHKLFHRWHGF
jgi:hypothetical protein